MCVQLPGEHAQDPAHTLIGDTSAGDRPCVLVVTLQYCRPLQTAVRAGEGCVSADPAGVQPAVARVSLLQQVPRQQRPGEHVHGGRQRQGRTQHQALHTRGQDLPDLQQSQRSHP